MSYILEALKKSQHERQLGKVPTLDSSQLESRPEQKQTARWTYAAVALALLAILIAAYSVVDKRADMVAETASRTVSDAMDPQNAIADSAFSQTRDDIDSGKASPAGPQAPRQPLMPDETEPAAHASDVTEQAARALEVSMPKRELTKPTRREISAPAALLSQLPLEFQQTVPPMSLDVHVFREAPTQRFVLINETLYREGEQTAEGAVIEEIVPDGVVLEYQGKLFRLGT